MVTGTNVILLLAITHLLLVRFGPTIAHLKAHDVLYILDTTLVSKNAYLQCEFGTTLNAAVLLQVLCACVRSWVLLYDCYWIYFITVAYRNVKF